MVRHVDALQAGQIVMALCHIAVVQPQVTQISKKLVKVIVPGRSALATTTAEKSDLSRNVWSVGSDDDETVPSNPDLLTQSDYTTSALSELPQTVLLFCCAFSFCQTTSLLATALWHAYCHQEILLEGV